MALQIPKVQHIINICLLFRSFWGSVSLPEKFQRELNPEIISEPPTSDCDGEKVIFKAAENVGRVCCSK